MTRSDRAIEAIKASLLYDQVCYSEGDSFATCLNQSNRKFQENNDEDLSRLLYQTLQVLQTTNKKTSNDSKTSSNVARKRQSHAPFGRTLSREDRLQQLDVDPKLIKEVFRSKTHKFLGSKQGIESTGPGPGSYTIDSRTIAVARGGGGARLCMSLPPSTNCTFTDRPNSNVHTDKQKMTSNNFKSLNNSTESSLNHSGSRTTQFSNTNKHRNQRPAQNVAFGRSALSKINCSTKKKKEKADNALLNKMQVALKAKYKRVLRTFSVFCAHLVAHPFFAGIEQEYANLISEAAGLHQLKRQIFLQTVSPLLHRLLCINSSEGFVQHFQHQVKRATEAYHYAEQLDTVSNHYLSGPPLSVYQYCVRCNALLYNTTTLLRKTAHIQTTILGNNNWGATVKQKAENARRYQLLFSNSLAALKSITVAYDLIEELYVLARQQNLVPSFGTISNEHSKTASPWMQLRYEHVLRMRKMHQSNTSMEHITGNKVGSNQNMPLILYRNFTKDTNNLISCHYDETYYETKYAEDDNEPNTAAKQQASTSSSCMRNKTKSDENMCAGERRTQNKKRQSLNVKFKMINKAKQNQTSECIPGKVGSPRNELLRILGASKDEIFSSLWDSDNNQMLLNDEDLARIFRILGGQTLRPDKLTASYRLPTKSSIIKEKKTKIATHTEHHPYRSKVAAAKLSQVIHSQLSNNTQQSPKDRQELNVGTNEKDFLRAAEEAGYYILDGKSQSSTKSSTKPNVTKYREKGSVRVSSNATLIELPTQKKHEQAVRSNISNTLAHLDNESFLKLAADHGANILRIMVHNEQALPHVNLENDGFLSKRRRAPSALFGTQASREGQAAKLRKQRELEQQASNMKWYSSQLHSTIVRDNKEEESTERHIPGGYIAPSVPMKTSDADIALAAGIKPEEFIQTSEDLEGQQLILDVKKPEIASKLCTIPKASRFKEVESVKDQEGNELELQRDPTIYRAKRIPNVVLSTSDRVMTKPGDTYESEFEEHLPPRDQDREIRSKAHEPKTIKFAKQTGRNNDIKSEKSEGILFLQPRYSAVRSRQDKGGYISTTDTHKPTLSKTRNQHGSMLEDLSKQNLLLNPQHNAVLPRQDRGGYIPPRCDFKEYDMADVMTDVLNVEEESVMVEANKQKEIPSNISNDEYTDISEFQLRLKRAHQRLTGLFESEEQTILDDSKILQHNKKRPQMIPNMSAMQGRKEHGTYSSGDSWVEFHTAEIDSNLDHSSFEFASSSNVSPYSQVATPSLTKDTIASVKLHNSCTEEHSLSGQQSFHMKIQSGTTSPPSSHTKPSKGPSEGDYDLIEGPSNQVTSIEDTHSEWSDASSILSYHELQPQEELDDDYLTLQDNFLNEADFSNDESQTLGVSDINAISQEEFDGFVATLQKLSSRQNKYSSELDHEEELESSATAVELGDTFERLAANTD